MNSEHPLKEWLFLIGAWKGGSEDQFGEEGEIETTAVFSLELNEKVIMGRHEARNEGKLLNASIGMMFYDLRNKKVLRKSFFTYGFVNNEVEYQRSNDEIRFDITQEPVPQSFDGVKWRSFIKKYSETKIGMGLESTKGGEDFQSYGETILEKVK
ncbi:MAG: hypothetical protein ACW97A_14910 [Candidatus Thorarchaeota archaeon]|jgi:hypothetical protein